MHSAGELVSNRTENWTGLHGAPCTYHSDAKLSNLRSITKIGQESNLYWDIARRKQLFAIVAIRSFAEKRWSVGRLGSVNMTTPR